MTTAVLVAVLLAAAVLTWPSAGHQPPSGWLVGHRGVGADQPSLAQPSLERDGLERDGLERDGLERDGLSTGLPPRRLHQRAWSPWAHRRASADECAAEVLDVLDGLAPALRAGLPAAAALRAVGSTTGAAREVTAALLDAADRGAPLGPVWRAYAARVGAEDLALVAAAWSLCDTMGSPLAPTVTTVADLVRRRRAVRQRVAVAVAGPRSTMRVLMGLPLAGPLIALAVGISPGQLYNDPVSAVGVLTGAVLLLGGWWWCRRLLADVMRERSGVA